MNAPHEELPPLHASILNRNLHSIAEGIAAKCNRDDRGVPKRIPQVSSSNLRSHVHDSVDEAGGITLADLLRESQSAKPKRTLAEMLARRNKD